MKTVIAALLGVVLWFCPSPEGVLPEAWHLFAIFSATVSAVVVDALPVGLATLMGLTISVATQTLSFEMAFSGYSNSVVWLILAAFFIAHGFIKSGLGMRIAYFFIASMGKNTLGLGYGLALSEFLLAPAIPSATARSGAIVYPITRSLADAFNSYPGDKSSRRVGSYLALVAFQSTIICSGMFLTAMAANPMAAKLALEVGAEISWSTWTLYAIVPGLCSLMLMPWLVYRLSPPELKQTPEAVLFAKERLRHLGPLSRNERLMLTTFVGLLIFWIFEKTFHVQPVVTALLGLSFLVLTGVLKWSDLVSLGGAGETFIWFGAFVALASGLNQLGLTTWFGKTVAALFYGFPLGVSLLGLLLIYFYIHYFFASSTAHVGALYLPFVMVAVNLGAPPLITALVFGFMSNLYGGLTHYGFGSAPIWFGAGYVPLKEWWRVGFCMSVVNLIVWLSVGYVWWSVLS